MPEEMASDVRPTEVALKAKAVVNATELADELGLTPWQVTRAQELGLIPPRDKSRGWSRDAVEQVAPRVAEIREGIADREGLGTRRLAELLAEVTGLAVAAEEVPVLAQRGHLREVDEYKGWPLYSTKDARALSETARAELAELVAAREERQARQEAEWQAWLPVSLTPSEAADQLGWRQRELEQVAEEGRIAAGRGGRYARADIEVLAGDEELCERVRGDRLIGAEQAAGLLEVRYPTDWRYIEASGWITPASIATSLVGRRREIEVPLYRTRDVEALRDVPGVDWEAVRAVRAGELSPLREYVQLPPSRADVVHAFAAALADRHQVEVWAYHDDTTGRWELDWLHAEDGGPTTEEVKAELRADPHASRYRREIQAGGTRWGSRVRWARPLLEPGAAVVLCTRSSGPPTADTEIAEIVDIAVLDAATGTVLLDTRVRPTVPIGERRVHQLTDQDLTRAPGWDRAVRRLRDVTRGRLIIAGNPARDRDLITADTERAGRRLMHLSDPCVWVLDRAASPLASVTGLPAREGCEYIRQALTRKARGYGRTITPGEAR